MTAALLQRLLLVSVMFGGVFAIALSVGYRWLRPRVTSLAPKRRYGVLLVLILSPCLAGLGLAVISVLPSFAGLFWQGLDHCPAHHAGHDHLCFSHAPGPLGGLGWLLLVGVAAWLLPRLALSLRHVARAAWAVRGLPRRSEAAGHAVVDSDAPFAVTTGILEPRVVVSSGLIGALPPGQLRAVLEHEGAHVRRRDPLWKVLSRLGSAALHPSVRRALLDDLELAAEQACDEEASVRVGDRLLVAQAIVTAERVIGGRGASRCAATTAFDDAPAVLRVEVLLRPRIETRPVRRGLIAVALTLAALASAAPLHHTAETLLGHLGR